MKADLRNYWIVMCLAPFVVDAQHRNKYTALLLGDEIADDKEFEKMFVDGGCTPAPTGYWGDCKFCFEGSCFHPFRPGSMCDAIFSSAFRGCSNGEVFTNEKACEALDGRRCRACVMCMPDSLSHKSAFYGVERFYNDLLEAASESGLYGHTFESFRKRHADLIDTRNFFETGMYKPYEDNVRRHFDKMMERHYRCIEEAIKADAQRFYEKDGGKKELGKAMLSIKFELVTHWMNYWVAQKYKEVEA